MIQPGPPPSAAPPASAAPAQDPTVAAYLKAIGFEDAAAKANSAKQIADINARLALQQPEINYQGEQALFNVGQDTLGRGVYSSGERLMGEARAQHATQYATDTLQLGASQGIGDAQLALANALAQNEAQRQALIARSGQASASGGNGF